MRLFGINLIEMKSLQKKSLHSREAIITLEYRLLWWSWTRRYRGWVVWYTYPSGSRIWRPLDRRLCSYARQREWQEEDRTININTNSV